MKRFLIFTTLTLLGGLCLVSCAQNTATIAGSVNGKEISLEDFYNSYRGHYSIFGYQTGRTPTKEEKQKIYDDTWRNITKAIILKDYYNKYNISASMTEVLDTLSNSIPEHIINSPRFKTDGVFNKKLYLQSLMTDQPENLTALRNHYQEYLIPNAKLQKALQEKEMLTSKVRKQVAEIIASNADLELYIFDPSTTEISLSDAEISSYYQANLDKYSLRLYYRLGYCFVPVIPDSVDLTEAKRMAEFIHNELSQGREVKDVLNTLDSKSVIASFTDNGYQKTDALPAQVINAIGELENGMCSEPIPYEKGYVLYQKMQSTKTFTLYNTIVVQALPGAKSLLAPETKAKQIMKLALNLGLEKAAEEFDLNYTLTPPMKPDSLLIPASDIKGKLLKYLKSAKPGDIIEPLFSAELSDWIIFEVVEKQTENYQSLEEVRQNIIAELSRERRISQNKQVVQQWIANPDFPAPYQLIKLDNVTIDSTWAGKPLTNIYFQAAKAYLDKSKQPQLIQDEVIIVPKVINFRPVKTKIDLERIKAVYEQTLPDDWFEKWLSEKVKTARLVIYTEP